jgi:tetratricopeptide (TPR) repeat protein
MRIIITFLMLLVSGGLFAQLDTLRMDTLGILDRPVKKSDILLNNIRIQIDANEAVNNLYNFKFAKAERQFRWIKQKYDWHPLPYYLLGLSQWWKIVPDIDEEKYDEVFLAYMDTAIVKAEYLYENGGNKVEAAFFQAAAHAFKARLYSERRSWTKAAFSGKNALKYLEESRGQNDLSPELLFGDALYNYYSVWIPENYPLLKPLLIFFSKGDKQLGINQLKEVSRNAFYTRTEAQFFLMRILALEENDVMGALQVGEYLAQTFPDNAYFQRFYARLLYTSGQYRKSEKVSLDILSKIDSGMIGYEANSGRYAGFFLGQIYQSNGDLEKAKVYYQKGVDFGEELEAYETGYYLYSLLNLAKIANYEEDEKTAKELLKDIKKYAKRGHPAHKMAREYLKDMRRK